MQDTRSREEKKGGLIQFTVKAKHSDTDTTIIGCETEQERTNHSADAFCVSVMDYFVAEIKSIPKEKPGVS